MEKAQLKSAIDLLLKWSFTINKYIQDTEFWGEKER